MAQKRLFRSRTERMIWGVCGGLAQYFGIDPTIVRLVAVLTILLDGLGILAYIILAIVVPREALRTTEPKETIKENIQEMAASAGEMGREIGSALSGKKGEAEEGRGLYRNRLMSLGIVFLILGIIFLLANFNLFWWFKWTALWPLVLVAAGLLLFVLAGRKQAQAQDQND